MIIFGMVGTGFLYLKLREKQLLEASNPNWTPFFFDRRVMDFVQSDFYLFWGGFMAVANLAATLICGAIATIFGIVAIRSPMGNIERGIGGILEILREVRDGIGGINEGIGDIKKLLANPRRRSKPIVSE